jgi:hypothetical protein
MAKILPHGRHPVSGREMFSLELDTPAEWPERLDLGARHFVLLIAGDARKAPEKVLRRLADRALKQGMVSFVAWGPDSERVHDAFDEAIEDATPDSTADDAIQFEWIDDEPLRDALWYAVHTASPAPAFEETCKATLCVTVASPRWAERIRALLADPERLSEEAEEE